MIFAIDPGNVYSAYCVMTDTFELKRFGKSENKEVLRILKQWLDEGKEVVIERVASYGLAVGRDVFETCEWIGRFTQAADERGGNVSYIYRKDEKVYLCGDMRAKDANIRAALIERFAKHDLKNGRGTKGNPDYFYGVKADIWAAIAVAVTHYDMIRDSNLKKEHKNGSKNDIPV